MKLKVIHLEGSKQGLTEVLEGQVISIGRDPSNTLSFDPFKDLDVSSRHASITAQGDQVMLQDLGSTNGTFLNGEKLTGAAPLPNGCIVQFGEKGPKLQLSLDLKTGPGKKTQMIQDLSGKLEEAGAQRKKEKTNTFVMVSCLVLMLILGGLGYGVYSWISGRQALALQVARAKDRAGKERAAADLLKASQSAASKAEWASALAAMERGAKAEQDEDLDEARKAYEEAIEQFDLSGKKAGAASQAALADLQLQAEKASKEAERARQELAEREARLRKELEEQNARAIEERLAKLAAAQTTAALSKQLDGLESSNNPEELEQGISALEKALAELPADSPERKALEEKLAKLQGALAEKQNLPERLKAAASQAKLKVVAIRSRVFALPRGQRPDTTKIRYPVAEAAGTGFFVSAKGHIVTAKEVVEPHLFDPQAMARHKKLKEKGMDLFTDLEVLSQVAGVYTSSYTSPQVRVARRFDDSFGDSQRVTIDFDNTQLEVEVEPHRRDDGDVVVLKVDDLKEPAPFLELAAGEAAAGLPLVALGTQQGDDKQLGLFRFEGEVKQPGKVQLLDVASFTSWAGGPILDPDGKVIGVLVGPDTTQTKAVAAEVFRSAIQ